MQATDMVFKESRNGMLKGCSCADGQSQRYLYDKLQTASPTVLTNALMLSVIINTYGEARDPHGRSNKVHDNEVIHDAFLRSTNVL